MAIKADECPICHRPITECEGPLQAAVHAALLGAHVDPPDEDAWDSVAPENMSPALPAAGAVAKPPVAEVPEPQAKPGVAPPGDAR